MKELSLNILDITMNSVKAGATLMQILITETDKLLELIIKDNGCGMTDEVVKQVSNPFYTTRTTRKVGMGIPLLTLAAEQTGGHVTIMSDTVEESPDAHGTTVTAVFDKTHLDFTPLGDMIPTITTLIQGSPDRDFFYRHTIGDNVVSLDTAQLREVLGDVSLGEFEVLQWIEAYLQEQYAAINP
ncbi:MAG: ATP-binding protein [Clostridia bacterium]|nr:ATP-binding protein [Clostridia bacterium]